MITWYAICCLMTIQLQVVWFVIKYIELRVTWFVVLNAIFFHFYHFHPYPSPRPGKYYHLKKRLQIALCGRIPLFYLHMIPYGVIFFIIEQKFENVRSESTGQKLDDPARVTWCTLFGKHYLHSYVNLIYINMQTSFTTISHIFTIIYIISYSIQ